MFIKLIGVIIAICRTIFEKSRENKTISNKNEILKREMRPLKFKQHACIEIYI